MINTNVRSRRIASRPTSADITHRLFPPTAGRPRYGALGTLRDLPPRNRLRIQGIRAHVRWRAHRPQRYTGEGRHVAETPTRFCMAAPEMVRPRGAPLNLHDAHRPLITIAPYASRTSSHITRRLAMDPSPLPIIPTTKPHRLLILLLFIVWTCQDTFAESGRFGVCGITCR